MVVGGADQWSVVFWGVDCVLFDSCLGVCNRVSGRFCILGNWFAVYVASSRKYLAVDFRQ